MRRGEELERSGGPYRSRTDRDGDSLRSGMGARWPGLTKRRLKRAPFCICGTGKKSGGAGIRTPVREKIDHSVYVRIPPIEVSRRWPVDSPLLDKSFLISPTTGRRDSRLSRIFDTLKAASGGLQYGQVQ